MISHARRLAALLHALFMWLTGFVGLGVCIGDSVDNTADLLGSQT
jgi:hypothetical protein